MPSHTSFAVTGPRGLDLDGLPMVLWQKAKALGIWDPAAIDLSQDVDDWARLAPLEREVLLHLASLFAGGEESVTLDLLPLIMVIAAEGRVEEEMYLTSFLWEEAKHVEAFHRFLREVAGGDEDLERFHSPSYRQLFGEELPRSLDRLRHDPSPVAQAEASATYNMIVEGVLAETGYHAYYQMLSDHGIMPGTMQMIELLKRDESRHIAYGVYLLSRLVQEHGDDVLAAIHRRMGELLPLALATIQEIFDRYEEMPFGLRLETFVEFAMGQFQSRLGRIERGASATG
jgi:ribonucleoside-diphosphate reductase beta chain